MEDDILIGAEEVARLAGVKTRSVPYLVKLGRLPRPVSLGYRMHRWSKQAIAKWVATRLAEAGQATA